VVAAGQPLSVTWEAWNQGDGLGNPQVGVYLSTNSTISTLDPRLDLRATILTPGMKDAHMLALTVPYTMPAGLYYVGAIIDPGNAVAEYDESNNSALSNFNAGRVLVLGRRTLLPLIIR
jgi:hypothetical protein